MLGLRVLVGVLGLLSVAMAARIWADPGAAAAQMGLLVNGPLGQATLRADVAGLFAAIGGLSVFGAVKGDGRWLLAPLCLVVAALAGRLLTLVLAGFTPEQAPPILIEVLIALILGAGLRILKPAGATP
ncbi:MAG: hypothetical protein IM658_01245 [Phenylobacterium sp.]|jgi:hypothetical protein|uniref:hypothetical protein n=1 Tax=Phenylobacterium sp. TaxID=1871053 RepID=UPI0025CDF82F|nr:hypothetical protein [Phenylobacterium sp.]MCA3709226.1 hypothetical protein [Phenylobacterium sp.]MCA3711615.1 hypothetical protein [Phenylobacterium sp.]MCA3723020.1 hypothetical protein [Phenylobacterium sp.]MCA3726595.1 hypothetical protein [Phenylobacterium sp.]MCA3738121.1 hypothetical protein [Phenylobacterium sp.]